MAEAAMTGNFVRVGSAPFPDNPGGLMYVVYEWTPPKTLIKNKFKIRFLSTEGDATPRLFFIEPVLRQCLLDEPSTFLEEACAEGFKVLAQFEQQTPKTKDMHRVCQALFRNRNRGHLHMGNRMARAQDYVDAPPDGEPSLITPGIEPTDKVVAAVSWKRSASVVKMANHLLRSALEQQGIHVVGRPPDGSDVIHAYQAIFESASNRGSMGVISSRSLVIPSLPGSQALQDSVWQGWQACPVRPDFPVAEHKVGSAFIFDEEPASSTEEPIDPKVAKRFFNALQKAVSTRTPEDFDRWLVNVRQHGFLSLVGSSGLKGLEQERLARQAERLYLAWTWYAYQWMARCWQALMVMVDFDFRQCVQPPPDQQERRIFRQMHLPQFHLGGLPLDFFTKPQLCWVIEKLNETWQQGFMNAEQEWLVLELLGMYGTLAWTRRQTDRQRHDAANDMAYRRERLGQSRSQRRLGVLDRNEDSKKNPRSSKVLPRPESPDVSECPECGYPRERIDADVPYCPRCDQIQNEAIYC